MKFYHSVKTKNYVIENIGINKYSNLIISIIFKYYIAVNSLNLYLCTNVEYV